MNVAEVRAEMDRILQWLVPVAESTTYCMLYLIKWMIYTPEIPLQITSLEF
jgi:hypothetical protein